MFVFLLCSTASQSPSVSMSPANKMNISPSTRNIAVASQNVNLSPNITQNIPKQTSPRTKQTPRKNLNPIRTTHPSAHSASASVNIQLPSNPNVKPVAVTKLPFNQASTNQTQNNQANKISSTNVAVQRAAYAKVPSTSLASITVQSNVPKPTISGGNVNVPVQIKTAIVNPMKPTTTTPLIKSIVSVTKQISSEKLRVSNEKLNTVKQAVNINMNKPAPTAVTLISTSTIPVSKPQTASPKQTTSQKKIEEKKSNENQISSEDSTPALSKLIKEVAKPTTLALSPAQDSVQAKAKRNRLKTIPYQSPTPEIELVSKISANEAFNRKKNIKKATDDEKLTLFYK